MLMSFCSFILVTKKLCENAGNYYMKVVSKTKNQSGMECKMAFAFTVNTLHSTWSVH